MPNVPERLVRSESPPPTEPTFAALATSAARRLVPSRVWLGLQLALPIAADFALRGWWRPAALGVALSLAGVWGVVDQWLWRRAPAGRVAATGRALRVVAAAGAIALGAVLLLDVFFRVLGNAPIS
jgi:hypothetical protein